MSISKVRSFLYKTAQILGDVDAVRKGRIGTRIYNRIIGKLTSRLFRK